MIATKKPLSELYEADETAWLETMSRLARRGDTDQLDLPNLAEYLSDMAIRDRREVKSRLTVLIAHLLKWEYQPERRCRSWRLTIMEQRTQMQDILESRTLRDHAESVLSKAYSWALELAAIETGLSERDFPPACRHSLDDLAGGYALGEPVEVE